MNTTVTMIAALGVELLLLLLAVLAVSFFRSRAAARRDRVAMKALAVRLKQGKGDREKAIEAFLAGNMGLSGEVLVSAKVAMLRAELALLQRFAMIYRGRESAMASRFDGDLIAALAPYHALTGNAAVTDTPALPADDAELESLRKENERLSDELRITMETMSRMLNEYSTMFAGNKAQTEDAAAVASEPPSGGAPLEADPPAADVIGETTVTMSADHGPDEDLPVEVTSPATTVDVDAPDDLFDVPAGDAADETVAMSSEPADGVDVVAEVMRAAATQEQSARGADGDPPVGAVDVDVSSVDVMSAGVADRVDDGPVEVVGLEDDLFDAVAGDAGSAVVHVDDDLFDAGEEPPAARSHA